MINYKIIQDAIEFYTLNKFQHVEVEITNPISGKEYILENSDDVLVASAEQSFLYQYANGYLPLGKFISTSPCFRHDIVDGLHVKNFIKSELIITDYVDENRLHEIIDLCILYFSKYLPKNKLTIVNTKIGFDIECCGYELGSYGIRKCDFLKWIYATGVAEPRLSYVIKKINMK